MITENKVIEIFCIMDEFCRNFASECGKIKPTHALLNKTYPELA